MVAVLPLAWLLPNHYHPWPTAWQDGFVLALLSLAVIACGTRASVDKPWLVAAAACGLSVAGQWAASQLWFAGDALMVVLYVAAFVVALGLGAALGAAGATALAAGIALAAGLSVAIALTQWAGVPIGLAGIDMPPGARPYANLGQANHLCSAAWLGLTAVLVLRETGRLSSATFWMLACWMLAGMVMSGSRTGWLQIGILAALGLMAASRMALRTRPPDLVAIVVLFIAATAAWPLLNDALQTSAGRGITSQLDGGGRWALWRALVDAVAREPWAGYGWQQMVLAQQAVAVDHPSIGRHFEHSHNLVLDLVLWAGLPIGLAVAALVAWALVRAWRGAADPVARWGVMAALGLFAHAMVEFPLEYAYFLVPAGLLIGGARPAAGLRRAGTGPRLVGAAMLLIVVALARDYLESETNHRLLRLESARIGTTRIESEPPRLLLLTQLEAFLGYARTPGHPDMSAGELDAMRQVAARFAYPASMLRYALAAGLNGRPDEADLTLKRLCRMHPQPRCDEAREGWLELQDRHPVLRAIAPP